jgi:hypothetical protein
MASKVPHDGRVDSAARTSLYAILNSGSSQQSTSCDKSERQVTSARTTSPAGELEKTKPPRIRKRDRAIRRGLVTRVRPIEPKPTATPSHITLEQRGTIQSQTTKEQDTDRFTI